MYEQQHTYDEVIRYTYCSNTLDELICQPNWDDMIIVYVVHVVIHIVIQLLYEF